jgi:Protein of unknown function (DUF3592)
MDLMVDFEIYSPQASPTRSAWSCQTTRRSLRRRFLKDVTVLVIGLLLVAVFVLILDQAHRSNRRLITHGVRTTGVITALHAGGSYSFAWIRVSYTAGQRRLTATVDVGSKVDRLAVGQQVDAYYDREHPTHMTVAGGDDQSDWSAIVMSVALVVGAGAAVTAPARLWVGLRSRRVLGRSPWREVPATIVMDARSRVVARVDEPSSPGVFRSPRTALVLRGSEPGQGVWTTGYLWIAGPRGRSAVLALPGGGDVLPLRSPRTAAQRRRWTRQAQGVQLVADR